MSAERTLSAVQSIEKHIARASREGSEFQQAGARGFALAIARTEAAALLIEHAASHADQVAVTAAERWCARELTPLVEANAKHRAGSVSLENGGA